mgnify:CR=1 FL=1
MCLGGLRRSLGTTFVKNVLKNIMVQKVSRKVQEGPRSPPDPLKKYSFILKFSMFLTCFLIAYCIAYCISRPWVSCRGFLWNNLHCKKGYPGKEKGSKKLSKWSLG